jgi:hypothetical protein
VAFDLSENGSLVSPLFLVKLVVVSQYLVHLSEEVPSNLIVRFHLAQMKIFEIWEQVPLLT